MPLPSESTAPAGFDKIVHVFLFGVLGFLLVWLIDDLRKLKKYQTVIMANAIVLAYALFLEYLQQFVPGRNPAYLDLLAGLIGSLIASLCWLYFIRRKKPRLLLHVCCIGCGAAVTEELGKDYDLTLFFYNPNIWPEEEYKKRLKETGEVAKKLGLKTEVGDYDHIAWLNAIKGYEQEPEKGERCRICYRLRLEKTAKLASEKKITFFTTTLTVSPHKDANAIIAIGSEVGKKYGLNFLGRDFKKHDGFKKACAMSHRLGLYRQDYCGCEFSRRATLDGK